MRRVRAGRDAAPARPASSAGLPGGPGPRPTDTTIRAQGACWTAGVRSGSQASARGECGFPHGSAPRRRDGAPQGERPDRKGRDAARRGLIGCAFRRSIPSDLSAGQRQDRRPGAGNKSPGAMMRDSMATEINALNNDKAQHDPRARFSPLAGEGGSCGAIASTSRMRRALDREITPPHPPFLRSGTLSRKGRGNRVRGTLTARPSKSIGRLPVPYLEGKKDA